MDRRLESREATEGASDWGQEDGAPERYLSPCSLMSQSKLPESLSDGAEGVACPGSVLLEPHSDKRGCTVASGGVQRAPPGLLELVARS